MAGTGGQYADADFGAVSLDFMAVDFETASSQPGSVYAVGLVRVRDGRWRASPAARRGPGRLPAGVGGCVGEHPSSVGKSSGSCPSKD
jgi:hypothetical protein